MSRIVTGVLLFTCFAGPAGAIVIADTAYNALVSAASPTVDGVNLSGVVELVLSGAGGTVGCSGSLLSDGVSILTAAHCVSPYYGAALPTSATAYFLSPTGAMVADAISSYYVNPAWTGNSTAGSDLAVLRLSAAPPSYATTYSLYQGSAPLGPGPGPELIAGYGLGGNGATGATGSFGELEAGTNEYGIIGSSIAWSSSLLLGEFYEAGNPATNDFAAILASDEAQGKTFYSPLTVDPYTATSEVDIAPGDSGGPSFYDGEIVGVHDLGVCLTASGECASVDTTPSGPSLCTANDSCFGEMYADTSVADNAAWIESQEVPGEQGSQDSQPVPEASPFALLALGVAALALLGRRRSALYPGAR